MSHREFARWLVFDCLACLVVIAAMTVLVFVGPAWTAGVLALAAIPLAVTGVCVWAAWSARAERRRRNGLSPREPSQLAFSASPTAAPSTPGARRASSPARRAQPFDWSSE